MKAIYHVSESMNALLVLIPKKRGKGYLKSPFGGHHRNDKYNEFLTLDDQHDTSELNDVDGYLHISLRSFADPEKTKKVLEELFPQQIEGWEEKTLDGFIDAAEAN
jgi:ABC-type tungstate transport system permease subunit